MLVKNTWIIIGVLVILAVGGYFLISGMQTPTPAPTPTPTPTSNQSSPTPQAMESTILLSEQNNSSESGTALLKEENGKVVASLSMSGNPKTVPQPAHIHVGACPDVGAVKYPLTNVVDGKSETTLDVTLAQLKTEEPLAINVHKSVPEAKVYVSCGNLAL